MELFDDPILGRLEWHAQFGEWQGKYIASNGVSVEFSLEDGERDVILPLARATVTWLYANEGELRNQLAARMLNLAKSWWQEGDPEITETRFAQRVELTHASLSSDGA